jgi:hypothetical protein
VDGIANRTAVPIGARVTPVAAVGDRQTRASPRTLPPKLLVPAAVAMVDRLPAGPAMLATTATSGDGRRTIALRIQRRRRQPRRLCRWRIRPPKS